MQISSMQNPLVKQIQKLDKSRVRRQENMVPVEGLREIRLANRKNLPIRKVLFCPDHLSRAELLQATELADTVDLVEVTAPVFDALVYRKGVPNALALVTPLFRELSDIKPSSSPLILVVDSVEKPGNLGAILRTCDAAGVDEVIVCDPLSDLYNPNCIRSSLGAVFTQNITLAAAEDCITWLKENSINTYVTYLESARSYLDEDYTGPTALVVGSEAHGIRPQWLSAGFSNIIIPQFGEVDSMNVSASTAILLFEAVRQRQLL